MRKRYQVFVGATTTDLEQVRRAVSRALMETDCCPVAVEGDAAHAARLIENCDYYVSILGDGHDGMTAEEVAVIAAEYEHAVASGSRVLVLAREARDVPSADIPAGETAAAALRALRDKALSGPLVGFWEDSGEVSGRVATRLMRDMADRSKLGAVAETPDPATAGGATGQLGRNAGGAGRASKEEYGEHVRNRDNDDGDRREKSGATTVASGDDDDRVRRVNVVIALCNFYVLAVGFYIFITYVSQKTYSPLWWFSMVLVLFVRLVAEKAKRAALEMEPAEKA